ncbi:MAG: saccharopine dehydrogenase, partial [Pseudomonadota bacterium]|nr:saccharopine dehydrogenase [Pseudomonadota bacterium]
RAQRLAGLGSAMVGDKTPKPGEGPSLEERESGYYNLIFVGRNEAGDSLTAQVQGDRDPGYGSTSKMIAESAVCLVLDRTDTPGGVGTTAPAMGQALIDRLQENAGLSFALVS